MSTNIVVKSPHVVTSKRNISYRSSRWKVHKFEVWSGEVICRVEILRMVKSFLIWLGEPGETRLDTIALGFPVFGSKDRLATTLLGEEEKATALASRLSILLRCPVYVCSGVSFDRFTTLLIEKGLIEEIKNRPDFFNV